ncbi:hypothetical protein WA026_013043 [Henosepilachna vigintioctopunctata]|uniref:Uncharacterized protein n=1 Tax=Henosepilachna vigintioctopunctata TaxID=420089 RepID=A0AAW1UDX6_9CUCU
MNHIITFWRLALLYLLYRHYRKNWHSYYLRNELVQLDVEDSISNIPNNSKHNVMECSLRIVIQQQDPERYIKCLVLYLIRKSSVSLSFDSLVANFTHDCKKF